MNGEKLIGGSGGALGSAGIEAIETIGRWVDGGGVAGNHVGHQFARAGTDAEAVAGEAGGEVEAGHASTGEITGTASGMTSISPPQRSATFMPAKPGKARARLLRALVDQNARRRRVEHAHGLERRSPRRATSGAGSAIR